MVCHTESDSDFDKVSDRQPFFESIILNIQSVDVKYS